MNKGGDLMKPKKSISWAIILVVAILVLPVLGVSAKEKGSSAIPKAEALSKLSKLHIPFIPNQGQMDEKVKYYARTFCGTVFVSEAGEISYSLPKKDGGKTLKGWVLKEELLGGSIKGIRAEEESPTRVSYFIGDDASRWRSDIRTYGTVSFGEVYEGIDVKLKAYGKSVEKLFYVRAGAKPGMIRLRLSGAESLGVNGEGELEVRTGLGEVKYSRPVAYQEVEGKRRYVEVSYRVERNEYGFKLGAYDRGRELVIDPILQSSYLGGSGDEYAISIAVGSGGNVYVTGCTNSGDFPGTGGGGAQYMNNGGYDAFVAELNPALTFLVQFTYLGGSGEDLAWSIATDSEGNVYVVGWTKSTNFPGTAGGAQPSFGGGNSYDGFVAKFNSDLTTILQSSYLGGSRDDHAYSIAISNGVFVVGDTFSTDFPATELGVQPSNGGDTDAFVARFNSALTAFYRSTYLGGSTTDSARYIATDSSGNLYVTGYTYSTNFPGTTGGAQPSFGGGSYDAFVAKLDATLTTILQSTYLGGNTSDNPYSIAIDSRGNAYVTGWTNSTNFPGTAGGAQPSFGGGNFDAFVAKLDPTLTDLVQSTYLGGSGEDIAYSIAIGSKGSVYVVGGTGSTNFPGTAEGPQPSYGGGYRDGFVAQLNPALTDLVQSTYLGGSGDDFAYTTAIGSDETLYGVGYTYSTIFPGTEGGAQSSLGGSRDAFVARLYLSVTEPPGAVTLISPSGTLDTRTPTYTWNAVATAAEYDLRVNDSTGNRILRWYGSSEAGCASGKGTCSVTPATALAVGPGKWWIQTRNSAGTGPLSSPMAFTVEAISAPAIPEGPRNAETGTSYAYTVRGSTSNAGDPIEYFFYWGDGTDSGWVPGGFAMHSWASAGTYLVKVQARCATHNSVVSSWSKTLSVTVETVSTPTTPSGPASGMAGTIYVYSTSDSTSGSGHRVQYLFDWEDGTNSGWLPVGKTSASKSWASPGTYSVRAKARCSTHNLIISDWSLPLDVSMQKLTVLAPNGGEVIPSGGSYTIEWTAPSQAEKFKIFYSMDNGATWRLITSDATGTSYNWDPVTPPPGNKTSCYVKVIGYDKNNVKVGEDRSDKPFTIGVVRLVSPNGGEVLKTGDPCTIQWEINGTKSPVTTQKLYYSMDGRATWSLITTLDGVPRTYDWTVPEPASNKNSCYIKVAAYGGSTVVGSDTSDNPFTIAGVNLIQPNGGEVLKTGDQYTIQWEIYGMKSPVISQKLYYSTDGGATWALITTLDGASRTYDWTVPTLTSNKNSCYVKVVAYSSSTVVGLDRSDKPFTIETVKLVSPNGGEVYYSGDHYSIDWEIGETKSPVTKVNLYYTTDGGAGYALIESIPTTDPGTRPWTMSRPWTVPRPPGNRANCRVKVVAYSGSTIVGTDTSDKSFTIEWVELLSPNGGEVLESGVIHTIQWEMIEPKYPVTATVRLYYSTDGGAIWGLITTLDGSFGSPRSYDWIPLVQTTKTKCKVKVVITYTTGITATDTSDGYFTILP